MNSMNDDGSFNVPNECIPELMELLCQSEDMKAAIGRSKQEDPPVKMRWMCLCGQWNLRHIEFCCHCGSSARESERSL
jgi:hypothetical protein